MLGHSLAESYKNFFTGIDMVYNSNVNILKTLDKIGNSCVCVCVCVCVCGNWSPGVIHVAIVDLLVFAMQVTPKM
jgi:hypothetical protein